MREEDDGRVLAACVASYVLCGRGGGRLKVRCGRGGGEGGEVGAEGV